VERRSARNAEERSSDHTSMSRVARSKYAAPVLRCQSLAGGSLLGRLRFIAGALGIVAGFFVYEYGFFLTLDLSPSLSGWTMTLVPWIASRAIAGATLQLAGGVLAIAGLLSCVAWVGSQSRGKLLPSQLPRTPQPDTQAAISVRRCRFCQSVIESDAAFCPQCQRAQV